MSSLLEQAAGLTESGTIKIGEVASVHYQRPDFGRRGWHDIKIHIEAAVETIELRPNEARLLAQSLLHATREHQ